MMLPSFGFAWCASRYINTFPNLRALATSKAKLKAGVRKPDWKTVGEQLRTHGASFIPAAPGRIEFLILEVGADASVAVWKGSVFSAAPTPEKATKLGKWLDCQRGEGMWRTDRLPLGRLN